MVSLTASSKATGIADGEAVTKEVMTFVGLSSDTKPTEEYNGSLIANGSTYFAMDTATAYMYDEANTTWHEL